MNDFAALVLRRCACLWMRLRKWSASWLTHSSAGRKWQQSTRSRKQQTTSSNDAADMWCTQVVAVKRALGVCVVGLLVMRPWDKGYSAV